MSPTTLGLHEFRLNAFRAGTTNWDGSPAPVALRLLRTSAVVKKRNCMPESAPHSSPHPFRSTQDWTILHPSSDGDRPWLSMISWYAAARW